LIRTGNILNLRGKGRAWVVLLFGICLTPSVRGQDGAAPGFKFTSVDTQVLADVGEFDRQLVKKGLVLEDPALNSYLDSIGKRLIGTRPVPEQVEFRFRVLRDPMVNAFALPNGSVYVTTGLLSRLENEAELASVLGHETSHVLDRHTYLENRSERKKAIAIDILQGVTSSVPVGSAFGAAIALGAEVSAAVTAATISGYSREMERQADQDGLSLMTAASYDPHAMARTFELLDEKLEFEPIEGFYNDHPKLAERRAAALDFASSQNISNLQLGSEKEYLEKVSPAICYNIEADINSRRARTAVARATRLTTVMPDEPKYQVLLADAYRSLGAKTVVPSEDELNRHGQAEHRKEYFGMTEQEEQRRLLQSPQGETTLQENLGKAETLYSGVIQRNPSFADAYRGLGFLYEQQAKYSEAAEEYHKYLGIVAGTSIDRIRIERRLESVEKLASPQPMQSR
jgi:predicted Zn-dependent protease